MLINIFIYISTFCGTLMQPMRDESVFPATLICRVSDVTGSRMTLLGSQSIIFSFELSKL